MQTNDSMTGLNGTELPAPDAAALAHSERLCAEIRAEMERLGGRIPFARYMELALYAPGLGYYSAGNAKLGAEGDFVTAPEISSLFARCVARQCRQVLDAIGGGDILEVGAGSGAMACDLLAELEALGTLPERYCILEVSADLRRRQHEYLHRHVPHLVDRIQWWEVLPAGGFQGVVLANEVIDAMPVHRLVRNGGLRESYVKWEDGGFNWTIGPLSDARLEARVQAALETWGPDAFGEDYVFEINLAAERWMAAMAALVDRGLMLVIDYGYPRRELFHPQRGTGTLMCHYRHRAHPDPLILTGLQDITAHVDFTALAESAAGQGLRVSGYTTQAQFLLASGLQEMNLALQDADPMERARLAQQIKRLTLPGEMGDKFKVLGLTRGVEEPLLGFALRDERGRL